MSTLCSAAILRTSGVDLVRRRCSAVWTPPSPSAGRPDGRAAGAAGAGAGAAAFGGAGGGGAGFGSSALGAAGAGAGAGFDAPALASVSSTATSVCTGTVCPSCTLISASVPAAGAGISASTLSVEISNSGSSRFTVSPTFLSHLLKVPSAIDSPIWGISTSTRAMFSPKRFLVPGVWCQKCHRHQEPDTRHLVFRQPSRRFHNIVSLREHEVFQSRRIRDRHVVRGHAHDRPVEPFERLLIDPRRDLARDPTGPRVFVYDQDLVRLLYGRDDCGIIHRQQGAEVQHFDRHAVRLLELLGRLQRFPQCRAVADDGKVFAFPRDPRLPDRRENLLALRQLLLDAPVEPFVLEVEDRIFVADRRLDQTLRIPHGRRVDDLEAGRVEECRFRILRMERPAANVTAAGAAHHHRRRQPGPVARGGDVIREHVVRARNEVDELHLGDRPQSHVRGARGGSHDRRLGDRCVDHARLAEALAEAVRDLERPAICTNVLAQDEDALVALHLFPDALAQRFEKSDLSHHSTLNQSLSAAGGSTYTPGSALSDRKTRSSRSISSQMPWRSASRNVTSAITVP